MKVAVLGCGPAGLLAAHAAELCGHEASVVSRKVKSQISGAQYLHDRIPGISPSAPDGIVTYRKEGTREGYAEKVYGDASAPVSWDRFEEGPRAAWSMFALYGGLWDAWESQITNVEINKAVMEDLLYRYDMVISTIPASSLCQGLGHSFPAANVWIAPYCWRGLGDDEILYNGERNIPWYRASSIFGHDSTESMRPLRAARPGVKPIDTDCDCWTGFDNFMRAGRFGEWKKGILVHHSFQRVMAELDPAREVEVAL